jgi:two-component system sensor histidine kinase KdpD
MNDRDGRPSPDALLKEAARQAAGRGKLKIFLGAAPGVGKTYEMLSSAQARLREGVDVVIGIVETHGRAETESLIGGLEVLARKQIDYKGRQLDEMDLDGLLARRPALALVDELAHSNVEGSRHPKRYLDVEELLAAGIDVYTTLNIQHVESLNDVVAQITRIRVRETVPDSIVDRADAIEVIDLTPDDLLQRLREGKVYVAKTATRAIGHYFSPGNLTALRELALRRTAQRVDAQLLDHMQAHAISGPWAAGDRVLVCVTRSGSGPGLVRYGRRLAERLRAPWTAIYVETPRQLRLTEADRDRIAECMRLAEKLGAEAVTIPGSNAAADILSYARENNFSHIVIGSSGRSGLWSRLRGSVAQTVVARAADILSYARENNFSHIVIGSSGRSGLWSRLRGSVAQTVVARAADIPVHVIGREVGGDAKGGEEKRKRAVERPAGKAFEPMPYIGSTGMVAAAVAIGLALHSLLAATSISLVFLTAVLTSASIWGLWPSLYACLASMLAYNFFFLPPTYTLTIADPENVVALFFFLVTAIIASNLAAGVRAQALSAGQRARTTDELYQFSRKLAGIVSLDDLLWATAYQMAAMLKVRVVLLLPDAASAPDTESVTVRAGYPPEDELDAADLAAAKWSFQNNRPAGRGADTLPGARRLFLPLRTGRGSLGVVGIDSDKAGPILTPDQRRLLDALSDQAAVSIERMTLAEDVDRSRLLAETERLRSALLTSISHDLRTPLASILGAASSLQTYHERIDTEGKRDLLRTIQDEAERLNRFVANLLDMTRLESGAVVLSHEAADLGELVGTALARAGKVLEGHRVEISLPPALPLLDLDTVLFEQILFNLLDNAGKYSPPGSVVTLRAWHEAAGAGARASVNLQVMDEGPGIPADALERVFDKFYRVHGADRQRAGTGLGLAVCRGFVEAMGGTIVAGNRTDGSGAVFTVTLPVPATLPGAAA